MKNHWTKKEKAYKHIKSLEKAYSAHLQKEGLEYDYSSPEWRALVAFNMPFCKEGVLFNSSKSYSRLRRYNGLKKSFKLRNKYIAILRDLAADL